MGILRYALDASYKRFYDDLAPIAKQNNKNRFLMFCDTAICTVIFGSGLTDYLNYRFYAKTFGERRSYVTIRDQDKFYAKVSPAKYKNTLSIKTNFMKAFHEYADRAYFSPEESRIEDLRNFLSQNDMFMEKPVDGIAGRDVKKVYANAVGDIQNYYNYLKDNRLFLDQYIIQHEKMSALCPKSVNTVRLMTSSVSGVPEIFFAGLRVGNGSADIDNFHGGGMGVLVDLDSGKLIGNATDKKLNQFECHPVTNTKFDGYAIPYWEEAKQMVCKAASVEPHIMVVGWDVAITENGPTLIEANRRPGFDMPQVLYNRGLKSTMKKILDEFEAKQTADNRKDS